MQCGEAILPEAVVDVTILVFDHQTNERIRMKRCNLSLFALGVLLIGSTCEGAGLNLTASTWPPYVDKTLPGQGLAMELVSATLAEAGYQPVLRIDDVGRTVEGTEIGVYDAVAALWYSDKRATELKFSEPYWTNRIKLLARKSDRVAFQDLADMGELRVGIVDGYAYPDELLGHPEHLLIASKTPMENLLALIRGNVDVVVGDELALTYLLRTYLPNQAQSLELLPKPLAAIGLHFAVSREHERVSDVLKDFNNALARIKANGDYDSIVSKYLAEQGSQPN